MAKGISFSQSGTVVRSTCAAFFPERLLLLGTFTAAERSSNKHNIKATGLRAEEAKANTRDSWRRLGASGVVVLYCTRPSFTMPPFLYRNEMFQNF